MHSYVTPADDAPRGFGAHFWPPLHGIGTPGSVFGRNFGAVFEHAKNCQKRSFGRSITQLCHTMSHPRRVPRAVLGRIFGHLCTALVHREAFFGRNFGAVFEHAKTLIREEHYTAMSHPGMVPRAGVRCAV